MLGRRVSQEEIQTTKTTISSIDDDNDDDDDDDDVSTNKRPNFSELVRRIDEIKRAVEDDLMRFVLIANDPAYERDLNAWQTLVASSTSDRSDHPSLRVERIANELEKQYAQAVEGRWIEEPSRRNPSEMRRVDVARYMKSLQEFLKSRGHISSIRRAKLNRQIGSYSDESIERFALGLAHACSHDTNRLYATLVAFDRDADGRLTCDEFARAMKEFAALTDDEASSLFRPLRSHTDEGGAVEILVAYQTLLCAVDKLYFKSSTSPNRRTANDRRHARSATLRLVAEKRKIEFYLTRVLVAVRELCNREKVSTSRSRAYDRRIRELVLDVEETIRFARDRSTASGHTSTDNLRALFAKRYETLEIRYARALVAVAARFPDGISPEQFLPHLGRGLWYIMFNALVDRYDPDGTGLVVESELVRGFEIELRLCVVFDTLTSRSPPQRTRNDHCFKFRVRDVRKAFDDSLLALFAQTGAAMQSLDAFRRSYVSMEDCCRRWNLPRATSATLSLTSGSPSAMSDARESEAVFEFKSDFLAKTTDELLPRADDITERFRPIARETERDALREVLGVVLDDGETECPEDDAIDTPLTVDDVDVHSIEELTDDVEPDTIEANRTTADTRIDSRAKPDVETTNPKDSGRTTETNETRAAVESTNARGPFVPLVTHTATESERRGRSASVVALGYSITRTAVRAIAAAMASDDDDDDESDDPVLGVEDRSVRSGPPTPPVVAAEVPPGLPVRPESISPLSAEIDRRQIESFRSTYDDARSSPTRIESGGKRARIVESFRFVFSVATKYDCGDRVNFSELCRIFQHPVYRIRTADIWEMLEEHGIAFDADLFDLMDASNVGSVSLNEAIETTFFVVDLRDMFVDISGSALLDPADKLIADASLLLTELRRSESCLRFLKTRDALPLLDVLDRLVFVMGNSAHVRFSTVLDVVRRPYVSKDEWVQFEARLEDICTARLGEDRIDRVSTTQYVEKSESVLATTALVESVGSDEFLDVKSESETMWPKIEEIFEAVPVDRHGLASVTELVDALFDKEACLREYGGLLWNGPVGLSRYADKCAKRWKFNASGGRVVPGMFVGVLQLEQELRCLWAETVAPGSRVSYAHDAAGDWHRGRKRGKELVRALRTRQLRGEALHAHVVALTRRNPDSVISRSDYFSADEFLSRLNRPSRGAART